jgi:hypothetical protein
MTEQTDTDQNNDQDSLMDDIVDTVLDGQKMVRIVEPVLLVVIVSLFIVAVVLMFSVGRVFWPVWLIEYRGPILGVTLFALLCFMLWSPVMIEATENTKTLRPPVRRWRWWDF